MTQITKLTPEQEQLRDEYAERYLDYGWSTEPADRQAAEEAMAGLYEAAGWKIPEFVWFDSPAQAVDTIYESTGERVLLSGVDGNLEAHWVCFYRFCQTLKEGMYEEKDQQLLDLWDQLVRSCGPVYPYENYCLMTERPVRACRNEEDVLHCDDGPALAYRDGFELYALEGLLLPEHLPHAVTAPWELTLEQVEDPNLDEDIRTVLQDRWCYEEIDSAGDRVGSGGGRYVREIGGQQIHEDVYTGYKDVSLMRALFEGKDGRKWLACSDSSTDRVYWIRVPNQVKTCAEAHESINGGIPDSDIVVSA